MFFSFEAGLVSQIDSILDRENVTLRDLMKEDDILQECKAQNQKLIHFLTKSEIIDEMIDLIISEPSNEGDERFQYKYANISCELLTSDVGAIYDALVSNSASLQKLCSFLESTKKMNPLLASFFSKTMSVLAIKRTESLFACLKSTGYDFVPTLLSHIQTSAIMDLLIKLITGPENVDVRISIVKWLNDSDLIGRMVDIFTNDFNSDEHVNAAQFLCDMIKANRDYQALLQEKADADPLLDSIESTPIIGRLLDNMLKTSTESTLVNGIAVLQSLLEYKRHSASLHQLQQQPCHSQTDVQQQSGVPNFEGVPQCFAAPMLNRIETGLDQMTPLDSERLSKAVEKTHAAIIPRFEDFHNLLLNPPKRSPIKTTVGIIEMPLGATRLEIAHLITALLSSNNPDINLKYLGLKTIPVLIDLFFIYPWNNFLHTQVEQSIKLIISNSKIGSPATSPAVESDSSLTSPQETSIKLVNQLFTEVHIAERLLEAWTKYTSASRKEPRPGFMGHIIKIANHINDNIDQDFIKNEINNLPGDVKEMWNRFVSVSLTEVNKRIQTPLVEVSNSMSLEDAMRSQEHAIQQVFIEYQMQQMTRSLCPQISFGANEFTELDDNIQPHVDELAKMNYNLETQLHGQTKSIDMFEQICSERAKASLDSNSSDEDDDIWEERDDISFSRTSTTNQRRSGPFESAFATNATVVSGDVRMEIDANDPWADLSSTSTSQHPMETTDPWAQERDGFRNGNANSSEDNWADFSSFRETDTDINFAPNTCVTSSSVISSSSTENQQIVSDPDTISEATEGNNSSDSIPVTEEKTVHQENTVTSTTSESSILNGPK